MHAPDAELTLAEPIPNSSMLHLPTITAPAARNRLVTVDSNGGSYPRSILDPAVVGAPRTQKLSLTAMGTPSSIEPASGIERASSPRDVSRRSSEASASAAAVESTPPTKALSCRVRPIAAVAALSSSRAEHSPAWSAAAASAAVHVASALAVAARVPIAIARCPHPRRVTLCARGRSMNNNGETVRFEIVNRNCKHTAPL